MRGQPLAPVIESRSDALVSGTIFNHHNAEVGHQRTVVERTEVRRLPGVTQPRPGTHPAPHVALEVGVHHTAGANLLAQFGLYAGLPVRLTIQDPARVTVDQGHRLRWR